VTFSARVPDDLGLNRMAQAVQRARAAGPLLDLTESNPTRAGFDYPRDLLTPLAHPRGLTYQPSPLGLPEARRAVAADYARRGIAIDQDRVVLSASTSDAYSMVFKLLSDAGDEVLVPRPSYPLFDHLTRLDGVTAVPYDLEYHDAWTIDMASVERAVTSRTRALLMVNPNNPTGSFVKAGEFQCLKAVCAARDVAIIADEVFIDYELQPGARAAAASVIDDVAGGPLTISLGGLSKSAGLPQLKLGWMALGGPDTVVKPALGRLELVCDTYLSVSTPVQAAAAELIERAAPIRAQIQGRTAANHRRLVEQVADVPACRVLRSEGGWYGVLQVPSFGSEEDLVVALVERDGVVVHPGYFFDFPRESYLIVSLLPPEAVFADGVDRILRRVTTAASGHA
jgi:aspartate/methionine/tyrosine aminotransferase